MPALAGVADRSRPSNTERAERPFLLERMIRTFSDALSASLSPVTWRLEAKLAEREGFEPPDPFGSTVFKTAALNHSATSPKFSVIPARTHPWCANQPALPCAGAQRREQTLSLFAKTPLRPFGHLSEVLRHTARTHPWCANQPALPCAGDRSRTFMCCREIGTSCAASAARTDVKSVHENRALCLRAGASIY